MTHNYHNLQQRRNILNWVFICFLNLKGNFLPKTVDSSFCHLWVQMEKSSDLLFREAPEGLEKILYFSFRQRFHFLVLGLNYFPADSIILIFIFQFPYMYFERVVFESARFLKLFVWPSYLFFKVFPVNPVYV